MRKEKAIRPDGRYIIYYSFDKDEPEEIGEEEGESPCPVSEEGRE